VIVLDSSFLIAFHNRNDAHHASASRLMRRVLGGEWGIALLPEYVFLEITTVVAARLGVPEASAIGELLLGSQEIEFVPCSEFFRASFDMFRRQRGGSMSFADAAIVAIARGRDASHLATFDRDFRGIPRITVVPR
jgi:predicted nucleic acid-binding protein